MNNDYNIDTNAHYFVLMCPSFILSTDNTEQLLLWHKMYKEKNMGQYKYRIYAIDSNYKEYRRTIYRKTELSNTQRKELSSKFADKLASKHNRNFILYGCNEV